MGSGKSSVARTLRRWGAHVVDADVLAREVVSPGTAGLRLVVAEFGTGLLLPDGSLNRAALAERVFANADQLARLEEIIHPLVHEAAVEQLALNSGAALLVFEVPLPGRSPFGEEPVVVVVDAPEEVRRGRLRLRGLGEAQIEARMASQPSREEWLALADQVVDNSGSEGELTAQVAQLWRELTGEDPPVGPGG
jgi:dephospho-CoA kinase